MNNFYSYNPTKIIFGKNTIRNIAKEIPKDHNILMVYGRNSIKKNGVYDQVVDVLQGYNLKEFCGIESNPEYEMCLDVAKFARSNNITFLLAVGGGSVIDATKFISLATNVEEDPWLCLTGKLSYPTRVLPFGCIQTRPGTGSEMNNSFVISRKGTDDKVVGSSLWAYPKFSVLDPETTLSLSPKQVANGIVDMFVHVLEQYITYPTGAFLQERQAEALLFAIVEGGEAWLENPGDYNVRANIMWCSAQALNGNLSRGVPCDWATHNIGHVITALYGLSHAETLAIILGRVWEIKRDQKLVKLIQYGRRIWGLTGSEDYVANRAIAMTEAFFEKLGLATRFSAHGLCATEVADRVSARFRTSGAKLGELADIGYEQIKEIILLRQ